MNSQSLIPDKFLHINSMLTDALGTVSGRESSPSGWGADESILAVGEGGVWRSGHECSVCLRWSSFCTAGSNRTGVKYLRRGWRKNEKWVTVLPALDEAKQGFQGSWSQWSCPCWVVMYSSKNSDCTTAPVLVGLYLTAVFDYSGCNSISYKVAKLLRAVVN